MKKKVLSLVLSASMVSSMLPAMAYAADGTTTFPDMPNDWSTTALQSAIDNGLLNGIDGKIAASENLTRAQMAAIVTRAFGTNGNADISGFGDVNSGDWFYNAMAAAVNMGAFQGDGTGLNPNANITRQEAFTVLARLFTLSGADQSVLNSFSDAGQVADWAKDSMASMVQAGYVSGDRNMLKPTSSITRAEFAQVMYNLLSDYMVAGEDGTNVQGNAILNQTGTLSNVTVSGDLIVGDGAGEGDVTLNNVTVSGRLLVRGGGVNTVTLEGNTTVGGQIVVNKPTGDVRVHNSTSNEFDAAVISDGATLTGEFDVVEVTASGTTTVTGATVNTVNVSAAASLSVTGESKVDTVNLDAASSKLNVNGNSTVTTVNVPESASNASIDVANGSTVTNVNTAANGVSIDGEGKVSNVKVEGNNTSVDTVGTKVTVASGVTGTTSNGKDIAAGTTVTTTANGTTGGGSTGGSTGGDDDQAPVEDEKEAIENVKIAALEGVDSYKVDDDQFDLAAFKTDYESVMGSLDIDKATFEALDELDTDEDGKITMAQAKEKLINLPWFGIRYTANEELTKLEVSYMKDGTKQVFESGNGTLSADKYTDISDFTETPVSGDRVVSYVIGNKVAPNDAALGQTSLSGEYVFTLKATYGDGKTYETTTTIDYVDPTTQATVKTQEELDKALKDTSITDIVIADNFTITDALEVTNHQNLVIQEGVTLTIGGAESQDAALKLTKGSLNVEGTLAVAETGAISTETGTTISVAPRAVFSNAGDVTIAASSTLKVEGEMTVAADASLTNSGSIIVTGSDASLVAEEDTVTGDGSVQTVDGGTVEGVEATEASESTGTFEKMSAAVYAAGYNTWKDHPENLADFGELTYTLNGNTIKASGELKPVTGFEGFNTTVVEEQSGIYAVWQVKVPEGVNKDDVAEKQIATIGTKAILGSALDEVGDGTYLSCISRIGTTEQKLKNQLTVEIDWDGDGTEYVPTTYTFDFSDVKIAAVEEPEEPVLNAEDYIVVPEGVDATATKAEDGTVTIALTGTMTQVLDQSFISDMAPQNFKPLSDNYGSLTVKASALTNGVEGETVTIKQTSGALDMYDEDSREGNITDNGDTATKTSENVTVEGLEDNTVLVKAGDKLTIEVMESDAVTNKIVIDSTALKVNVVAPEDAQTLTAVKSTAWQDDHENSNENNTVDYQLKFNEESFDLVSDKIILVGTVSNDKLTVKKVVPYTTDDAIEEGTIAMLSSDDVKDKGPDEKAHNVALTLSQDVTEGTWYFWTADGTAYSFDIADATEAK